MGNLLAKEEKKPVKQDLPHDEWEEVRAYMEHGQSKAVKDPEAIVEGAIAGAGRAVADKVPDDVKRAARDAGAAIKTGADKVGRELDKAAQDAKVHLDAAGKQIKAGAAKLADEADATARKLGKSAQEAGDRAQDSLSKLWNKTRSGAGTLLAKVDDASHREVSGWKPLGPSHDFVIPPAATMMLGWASLLGAQAFLSLPQYREKIENALGGKTNYNIVYGGVLSAIGGALGYYFHKEGQFLGPNVNHSVPKLLTDLLKGLSIVGASQTLVNYAPSFNDLISGKVGLLDEPQTVGARKVSRHNLLYSLGGFGLATALEKRNLGNWLFWGFMPVYATIAGYLNDRKTDQSPEEDFLPFQDIINGKYDIVDVVKETNWPAAIVALAASLPKVFPEIYKKITAQLGL